MNNEAFDNGWNDPNSGGTSWIDPVSNEYHMKQWTEPKESTKAFGKFFSKELSESQSIIDIGAGAGAATYYLAREYPDTNFIGIDHSSELIEMAKKAMEGLELSNLSYDSGDWFDFDNKWKNVNGVISLQTLSWLPEMRRPMTQIFEVIKPNWIGLSSLFYDGDISCKIEVYEHTQKRKTLYNVYSLKELNRLAAEFNFEIVNAEQFEIPIDIPKPKNIDIMGTYTEKIEQNLYHKRLQISGPLLMNWHFVLLKKIE